MPALHSSSRTPVPAAQTMAFEQSGLGQTLEGLADSQLDDLEFGVIGFDRAGLVRRYNDFESKAAGLSKERVLGLPLFTLVAPCMNNYLVAQRFEDSAVDDSPLDVTIDYVLTLRMRPVQVKLRLLASPGVDSRFVLVQRTV